MSTGRSSTSPGPARVAWAEARRAVVDVAPLLRFRLAARRGSGRHAAGVAVAAIGLLTVLAGWLPAYLPDGHRTDVLLLLPSGYIGVLVISMVSAAASGGGRELLARDQAVAFPVSPTTDHLGALLMAPLNLAWLMQSWALLGGTAYVVGPTWRLLPAQIPVLAWLTAATAIAQLIAWVAEWVRRGEGGVLAIRVLVVLLVVVMAVLIVSDLLVPVLDRSPTVRITLGALYGASGRWLGWFEVVAGLACVALASAAVGALVSHAVVRRPPRDELRMESSARQPRANPTFDLAALLRVDRAGIWRSVPLRRGLAVLAILPGLVAVAGGLQWEMLSVLPGLVASGGALLFGVNSWCLDGRGALWRDSLPASPRLVFLARVVVLVEVLLLATLLTLVLASLRAGVPTASELAAVLCCAVVVAFQVVATSLRWSVRHPYAVDLRSARATPAPPLVMVGYSARLALSTTLTGLVFSVAAHAAWHWALLLSLPFLLFSGYRLAGTTEAWANAETRSRVIATVAS